MRIIVSYADLVIVAALHFMKRTEEKIFERAIQIEPAVAGALRFFARAA